MTHRIGLNAHLLALSSTYRSAGINGYIQQLLKHLPGAAGGLCCTAYCYDPAFQQPDGLTVQRSHWDTRRPWRRILWEQTRLAWLSRGLDLLHGLAYANPLATACPTVVTVHDLSFIRYPETFPAYNRIYLKWITQASTRRAAAVIAVSESTRRDVIALCNVPAGRVKVIPNGVTDDFCPAAPEEVTAFRARRGLPAHFILFVGTLEPRKNLVRLIDAYGDWRAAQRATVAPPKLVIAGGTGWFYHQIFAHVVERGLEGQVLFPGFLPRAELPWWYRAADLFVYPSLFEGFGLPVLEAMACGTPTVTSATSALPEVAGDAALLVHAEDPQALAAAIDQVLRDPGLAGDLSRRGLGRAAQFTWARTAAATADLYRAVLGGAA
jgi:glycosyltransferase involved in cell wall biosynthesis